MQEMGAWVELAKLADTLLKWLVAPMAGVLWMLHKTQQDHRTDLAVLKAEAVANKQAHDREFKELRDSFKAVMSKLDSIEEALRK